MLLCHMIINLALICRNLLAEVPHSVLGFAPIKPSYGMAV